MLLTSLASRTFELVVEQAKAWNADLIVIGAHGRRGIARAALGSDAKQILLSAPVPVLLVRAPHADGDAVRSRAAAGSTPHVAIEA